MERLLKPIKNAITLKPENRTIVFRTQHIGNCVFAVLRSNPKLFNYRIGNQTLCLTNLHGALLSGSTTSYDSPTTKFVCFENFLKTKKNCKITFAIHPSELAGLSGWVRTAAASCAGLSASEHNQMPKKYCKSFCFWLLWSHYFGDFLRLF